MPTDDMLLALRDQMRDHRQRLSASTFEIDDLIRAVDTLLEVEELKLEAMVKRLVKARQQQARIERGADRQRRRRKTLH